MKLTKEQKKQYKESGYVVLVKYPIYVKSVKSGYVLRVDSEEEATVISAGKEGQKVGATSRAPNLMDTSRWIPWHKPVETYPIYKQSTYSNIIVKFTDLDKGVVIRGNRDYKLGINNTWKTHTSMENWKEPDVLIDKERDLYDKQPVMVWQDKSTHRRELKFYNVLNNCTFGYKGERIGYAYENYEPVKEIQEWMVEAQKTLED